MPWLVTDGYNFTFEVDVFLEMNVREEEFVGRSFCFGHKGMALSLTPLGGESSSTWSALDFFPLTERAPWGVKVGRRMGHNPCQSELQLTRLIFMERKRISPKVLLA